MAAIDVSSLWMQLLDDEALLSHLPPEIVEVIRDYTAANFLDAVAAAALIPRVTSQLYIHFESVFADICARWLLKPRNYGQDDEIVSAFARILPFAPHLSVFLEKYIRDTSHTLIPGSPPFINSLDSQHISQLPDFQLLRALLAVWRLLNFDKKTFGQLVKPSQMVSLFQHDRAPIRYLAIRVFCCQLDASYHKTETLLREHIKTEESLLADFDGHEVDYNFLSIFEHKRAEEIDDFRSKLASASSTHSSTKALPPQILTDFTILYGKTLLPRLNGVPTNSSTLVQTPTTSSNLEALAENFQKPGPILLHGLPGSGKTSCVHELARELGMESTMVTLHLNEQTDAKMLIGLYSTDSKPGSFSWRPGVLTTAVREGRWVLIEDLDRAPNEVMSTLLPLIEHGRLLIPSRGEIIEARNSFRLFATVRTTRGMLGQESIPNLLGQRFWHLSGTRVPPYAELEQIVVGSYPFLHQYIPMILSVYKRLSNLAVSVIGFSRNALERPITPRDLLKWSRRLSEILIAAGCNKGDEPISETTRDYIFMEAVDCFCGSFSAADTKAAFVSCIAEEMHLPRQLMEHYLTAHVPQMEDTPGSFKVGRVMLTRRRHANRVTKSKKPFASTSHAKRLLEQITLAVKLREPVLLVGETGIGKTTVVQQLAETLGHKLVAVNLSQQSEVGDLLGGFKPINARSLAVPLKEEFEDLFSSTGISASRNQKYLEQIGKCMAKGHWTRVSKLWREAPKMFDKILEELQHRAEARDGNAEDRPAVKRRKTESKLQSLLDLRPRWETFSKSLDQFDIQVSSGSGNFAFAFLEGNIVKAARNGDWVLLDEINLASPDTLESLADLLASGPNSRPSILLSETGEIERVQAHPDFRIFGAMNPATDIGKRDLPLGLRSRFTELYVSSPDRDLKDLLTIIKAYLSGKSAKDDQAADDIARLYLNTKKHAEEKRLVDGANEVPHFSLRTLTRVLTYVNDVSPYYGLRRSLYEGFSMGFLTLLDRASEELLRPLLDHYLLDRRGSSKSILSQPPKYPNDGRQYVKFMNNKKDRQYWLLQGAENPMERTDYIITPYVERNLLNLVRATSTRRFPVLIQGPTSAGKTSMIEYLANYSGNKFVRINNHEHTDLQEYLGTYVSDSEGKLRFQEGLLVQALRQGHWIVLDELNLAPTDVLEALNRLLDDNRELLIPETQEVVHPHENFMLFATQNPPGLYGGRKVLSRAFRNRFLELHFDDIPEDELETILQKRSLYTAPSDCKRIVNVYKELSRLRQNSRVFENKDSFATLRDLFRWALRGAETREEIAANGFMLLAERVRNEEERTAVKTVIEAVFKVKIDQDQLYDLQRSPHLRVQPPNNGQGVVWTQAMRRLYVLVASALRHNEPVLLVGETGCGKTTVCQLLAESLGKELHIVNAHQNTETGDLIGSQRPIRNRGSVLDALIADLTAILHSFQLTSQGDVEELLERYHALDSSVKSRIPDDVQRRIAANEIKSKALFEWADGSLVQAMRDGQFFLLDEISLADDSVLERLNSVLEPQRSLLLAEKGIENSFVKAGEGFQFLATMNPGGDFGKKELSPALRNRFTEIWVQPLSASEDVLHIVLSKLRHEFQEFANAIVEFSYWFGQHFRSTASTAFSIRDILVWVKFINESNGHDAALSVIHGASTIFIDTLGANPSALIAIDPRSMDAERQKCLDKLSQLLGVNAAAIYRAPLQLAVAQSRLQIGDFSIERTANDEFETGFALHAPTTKLNAMRVIRALQVQKPILLEGSPGVGKTTLVSALARACGRPLTRINLSDQTDLMDLFGTDVPVEGAEAGHFAWRDAPFLRAMQNGEWVLLDEMNLASQSVLEGLNACLDHRGEVYVSELDQVFKRHPDFRLFAAQNPHHQGGGRKGLPSSFVNRFIVVYADMFSEEDLLLIARHNFPTVPSETVQQIINFISKLEDRIVIDRAFGSLGSPWEFNLRDTLRWLHLLTSKDPLLSTGKVDDFLNIIIRQRFRSYSDREEVNKLFLEVFGRTPAIHELYHDSNSRSFQVGLAMMKRNQLLQASRFPGLNSIPRLPEIESLLICVKQNIPAILVGPSGSGKSMLLQHVAALAAKPLVTFSLNADVDTMDLVGGFEQSDPLREINIALKDLRIALQHVTLSTSLPEPPGAASDLLNMLENFGEQIGNRQSLVDLMMTVRDQTKAFPSISNALEIALGLLELPIGVTNPRFEWLDGIIVQALQQGHWLVLDNANLCSASVLDRLNSLLEPDGFLIINEHCGQNGEPRIVKPHPDFRVFLTADPRYGELSRAMRNRAIEIYIEPMTFCPRVWRERIAEVDPSLQRFKLLMAAIAHDAIDASKTEDTSLQELKSSKAASIAPLALDSLCLGDLDLARRYRTLNTDFIQNAVMSTIQQAKSTVFNRIMTTLLSFIDTPLTVTLRSSIAELRFLLPGSELPDTGDSILLHPLQNSNVVGLYAAKFPEANRPQMPFWLGACYELQMDIMRARKALEDQKSDAADRPVSLLNRLQRSYLAGRVSAVSKDSTAQGAKFLVNFLKSVHDLVEQYMRDNHTNLPDSWVAHRGLFQDLMHLWWTTFRCLSSTQFEEAQFRAHLGYVQKMLFRREVPRVGISQSRIQSDIRDTVIASFNSNFKLTTGLDMENLWNILRPLAVTESQLFGNVLEMEDLAKQFDDLKWKSVAAPTELAKIMISFSRAYRLVRLGGANVQDLLATLRTEMQDLVNRLAFDVDPVVPIMAAEFDSIRRIATLECMQSQFATPEASSEAIFLSDLPLTTQLRLASATDTSQPLLTMESLFCTKTGLMQLDENLAANILRKLRHVDYANLGSLSSIETELPILAKQLGAHSDAVTNDKLEKIHEILWDLMMVVIKIYNPAVAAAFHLARANNPFHFIGFNEQGLLVYDLGDLPPGVPVGILNRNDGVVGEHLIPALVSWIAFRRNETPRRAYLANAWIQFSVALVKLYVPDKPLDPQLRSQESLKRFMKFHTGQSWSMRCKMLEGDIDSLGDPPIGVVTAFRPTTSQLPEIQGEFNNILDTVLGTNLSLVLFEHCSGSGVSTQQLEVIRENISRINYRLIGPTGQRYREYEDIILPTVNILHCLELGLSLGKDAKDASSSSEDTTSSDLLALTPFLGGKLQYPNERSLPTLGLEFLAYAGAVVSVEGQDGLGGIKQDVFEAIHMLYDQWASKLEADRKMEEARSKSFHYKGSMEDEEEEAEQEAFDELFPQFDGDQNAPKKTPKANNARTLAIRLAKLHKHIFLAPRNAQQSIVDLTQTVAKRVVAEAKSALADRTMLTAAIMALDDRLKDFSSTMTPADFNFYVDKNIYEARKLVNLVNDVRKRFRQLQLVDEIGHMQPLADVVMACDGILEIGYSEPLAQFIPKLEHLHGLVYEWQYGGWASKTYAVPSLHTRLTDMLVSWRRLELSTWSRLFDMEVKKCEEDASSWWFVAYQAIVVAPMNLAEAGENLHNHAAKLLKELESYFNEAPIGQFLARLSLLRQLHRQLDLLVVDFPSMLVIRESLRNFVDFYSRYEKTVEERIRADKAPIEKQMKDVLLLASWKDTNVVALRESARKSHQKLFRIVRKFREVLNQQMKPIVDSGLPDAIKKDNGSANSCDQSIRIDHSASIICSESIQNWQTEYKRIANVSMTVEIMAKLSKAPPSAVDAGKALDDFVSNMNSQALELRKETPAFLTEENTGVVKQLKTRKRKLFADTLKGLRQMGFQYNLSLDVLSKQDSLSTVLATTGCLLDHSLSGLDDTNYYFHKLLDFAPRFRSASQDHSEDLTGAEITRSIGFLEGILHVSLGQRRELLASIKDFDALSSNYDLIRSLSKQRSGNGIQVGELFLGGSRSSAWLVEILRVGVRLVELHAKFATINSPETLHPLHHWREQSQLISDRWSALPALPQGLISNERLQLENEVETLLVGLHGELDQLCRKRPDLAFIFEQIQLWTAPGGLSSLSLGSATRKITNFSTEIKTLCDGILVTIEQFRNANARLPATEEDAGWLLKSNEITTTAIRALHTSKINQNISHTLGIIKNLDLHDPSVNKLAMSLVAAAAPIIEQYQRTCTQALERMVNLHQSTCKLGFMLGKSFTQLASHGFCTPQEKSDETSGETEKLESGTGLGEGEGAEDISKDIQPDEDLSELAQEKNKESNQDMEDEKDAVDMADEELQGEDGDANGDEDEEKGSKSGDDESDNELDEETGDVDDLDPTAVDEKMWDGEKEDEAEKDQKGENTKGQKKKDEELGTDQKPDAQDDQPEDQDDEAGDDQDEEMGVEHEKDGQQQEELNQQDQNVQEQDTLALPDEMDIDGEDAKSMSSISDDDLDQLSDVEQQEQDEKRVSDDESENGEEGDTEMAPAEADKNDDDELEQASQEDDDGRVEEDDQVGEEQEESSDQEKEKAENPAVDDNDHNNDTVAPSDVHSGGQDQDAGQDDEQDATESKAAQQENGQLGENAADQDASSGQKGSVSQSQEQPSQADMDDAMDSSTHQPFKALGDALEKWHRQQQEIKESREKEPSEQKQNTEQKSKIREFQHLENDDAAADAQAMGTATEEQSQPIDDAMAIDEDDDQPMDNQVMPENETEPVDDDGDKMDTSEQPEQQSIRQDNEKEERNTGVSTHQGTYNRQNTPPPTGAEALEEVDETVEETSTQLSSTHLNEPSLQLRDFGDSLQQWTTFQGKTHPLSLSLTSQLRLILTPSQSTKLSGSYRTGKRLNIKRIIPYIASSYKRDKIWMRRAIPTKRSYQILLCVDDSRSMGESSSGELALESLVMVSRALTMLEVGQIGVLGFGQNTFMAHEFAEPFTSHDAGAKVLQKFSFQQDYTDIQLLIRQTIERFRLARQQSTSRGSEDLWQLALILSDGLTPSAAHDEIRVLLRQAMEERIMIVFIIMDDTTNKKDQSVLNLKKVRFLGNDQIKTEFYLDTFPFQYYLIVHNLEDLPGALAGLLRTWFAEVNN
ncbi:hypothetical protein F5Y15DRAFT_421135 [Xylariaceae sp. FL0016]|nr:hypothetical protein F5Y15DRAFT_421135 [Xylariaceae sp. FL0016]